MGKYNKISSVQFSCSVVSASLRPHESQHTSPPCPSPTPGVHSNSFMSIKSVMPSSHLILCCLLLLPPIPPSIRVLSNESTLRMRWPKYWSFSFSISPSNEHPGLIFRMEWLDLLVSPRDSQESSPTPQFKSINYPTSILVIINKNACVCLCASNLGGIEKVFLTEVMFKRSLKKNQVRFI